MRLLLPASTERPVDLHERREFAELRLDELKLGAEQTRVAVEDLQVTRCTALIPQVGEAPRILRGDDERLLRFPELTLAPVADEGIGHLAECLLQRLTVDELRLESPRLHQLHLRPDASGIEHRLHRA